MIKERELSFGIFVPQGWKLDLPPEMSASDQWKSLLNVAKKIETLGFDGAWVYDHFHTFPIKEERTCFEAWTTLTAIAPLTNRIRLGQMVTCQAYRNPAVLAKISSCLDVISNGRVELGLGAGWYEEEYNAYGIEFPKASVRIEQLQESLQIIKKMWTEEESNFNGKYYNLINSYNHPKPIQKPHPPITIGGAGEKLTLKVVAEHADRWNIDIPYSIDDIKHKSEVLKNHCKTVGRNFEDIELSVSKEVIVDKDKQKIETILKRRYQRVNNYFREHKIPPISYEKFLDFNIQGTPKECVEQIKKYIETGASHFVLYIPNSIEITPLELLAEEVIQNL